MVKIVPKFTKADIKKLMLQKKQAIIDAIVFNLNQIGENFVVNARSKTKKQGGFGDITGNLRSSIGYAVLYNGAVLNDNLEGTIEGVRYARKAIADIKKKVPIGLSLICLCRHAIRRSSRSKWSGCDHGK